MMMMMLLGKVGSFLLAVLPFCLLKDVAFYALLVLFSSRCSTAYEFAIRYRYLSFLMTSDFLSSIGKQRVRPFHNR